MTRQVKKQEKKVTDTGVIRNRIKITITIINRLKILVEKVDNRDDQVGNFSRQMKNVRKHQMKILE